MRYIFWDMDGVLNHPGCWGNWIHGLSGALDPVLVVRAAKLVKELDAKCILSSTWRSKGLNNVVEALQEQGWTTAPTDFIGSTPLLGKRERFPGDEIGSYLKVFTEVTDFVIVDDDTDMGKLLPRLVRTKWNLGLQEADCKKIRKRFGVKS